jgi:hypothetical protein
LTTEVATVAAFCPYKGPESFNFVDRPLFFGRRNEDRLLSARIALQPLSIITGPAGCGKSSLLRTGVVPSLLAGGWACVYVQPGNEPKSEVATGIRQQTRPNFRAERMILNELLVHATDFTKHNGDQMSSAREWFANLAVDEPLHSRLIVPELADRPFPDPRQTGSPPFISQSLSGLIDSDALAARLARRQRRRQSSTRRSSLSFDDLDALVPLEPDAEEDDVAFDMIREAYHFCQDEAKPRGYRGLVIILDQAEELFTRFGMIKGVDTRPDTRPWNIRAEFFAALRRMMSNAPDVPLRFCISLRREWFTALRVALGDLAANDEAVYHLALFVREQAQEALEEPAKLVGAAWNPDASRRMLDGLTGEDNRIDPFLLAISATLVWTNTPDVQSREIVWEDVAAALGLDPTADGIGILLEPAVAQALAVALRGHSISEQFDMLEIIGNLATPAGTRLFLPKSHVVDRPLRKVEQLDAALTALHSAKLVRIAARSAASEDDPDVEIRHDRLFEPARRRLQRLRRDESLRPGRGNRSALPAALGFLVALPVGPLDLVDHDTALWDRLPAFVYECLSANANLLSLDEPAAVLMLAGLLNARLRDHREGWARDEADTSERGAWSRLVRDTTETICRAPEKRGRRLTLTSEQAAALAAAASPDGDRILAMIEQELCSAHPAASEQVIEWIGRWERLQ